MSSTYVFYDLNSEAFFQSPPLQLISPGTNGIAVVTGSNKTWANITAKATTNYSEITRNGGFDTNPNGWLYNATIYSGSAIVAAYWNQTYYFAPGASGIVLLYMRLYSPSSTFFNYVNGSIYLVQNVTIPKTAISSVVLNITYYFEYLRNFAILNSYYLFAELLYPNGTIAWNGEQLLSTGSAGSWNNATFIIPSTDVVPGKTYTLLVGAKVDGYTINLSLPWGTRIGNLTIYQLFDSVRLYVRPLYPSFSGSILDLNVTGGTYNVLLEVVKSTIVGGTNVNLTLTISNISGITTTPITILEGTVTSNITSSILLTVPPPGYTSGNIHLSTAIYPSSIVNMLLKLTYGVGGVTVTYYINVTVIDPPCHFSQNYTQSTYGHKIINKHKLVEELRRLDNLLLKGSMHGLVPLERWRG